MRLLALELGVASLGLVLAGVIGAFVLPASAAPGELAPHLLGVLGTLLMLYAEVAHSLRRRSTRTVVPARLSLFAHVVAGLVGPALVLVHTRGHYAGLAGVLTLLTVLVVLSGATGRYLYPLVAERDDRSFARRAVAAWHLVHVPLATTTVVLALVHAAAALYFRGGLR